MWTEFLNFVTAVTQWKIDRLLQKFDSFLSSKSRVIYQKIKRKFFSVQEKIQFY